MPRLESFDMKIKTGERGPNKAPSYEINGFKLDFDEMAGGNGPGETLELSGEPQSFPHSLVLIGPEDGAWDIAEVQLTYQVMGGPPYTVRLGAVTLDGESNLNIWYDRPPKVIDV
ncbi:MAG: helicase [Candidatus Hydrogenedens sp.]|nr:helicase [Candidatus Hydrogenedens sp.]